MKRIKILSFFLLAVMLFACIPSFINDFMFGFEIGLSQNDNAVYDLTGISLRPNESSYYTPIQEFKMDTTNLKACLCETNIAVPQKILDSKQGTPEIRLYNIASLCMSIFSLLLMVALVWIIILILRVLFSIFKTKVFDRINIRRISRIGWILLSTEVIFGIVQYMRLMGISKLIDLGAYHINYWASFDISNIIIALIVLLMNELLRLATDMKEEQDLTI